MKDFLGKQLELNDIVVIEHPQYRDFIKAKIIGFTPQQVRVEYFGHYNNKGTYLTPPEHMIKI